MRLNPSKIDYLAQAKALINRPGYTLNIVTGCKHGCEWCYARRMVEHGRLKGHKSYPYGFEPTFHPERVRKYGGKPKLIFLNDMGDVGGDWDWKSTDDVYPLGLNDIMVAQQMVHFALLNPQHIILLLTKRPEWYALAEWPDNVYCGFSATNNEELDRRIEEMPDSVEDEQILLSLEPWLDPKPPDIVISRCWTVIGGLSGPNARPVSRATRDWLCDESLNAKRFTKANAGWGGGEHIHIFPRDYPASWRVEVAK